MNVSLLNRPRRRRLDREPEVSPGTYLTDETGLYRCVPSEDPSAVLLEDCLTLEHIHCYFDEVATMRVVRSGARRQEVNR